MCSDEIKKENVENTLGGIMIYITYTYIYYKLKKLKNIIFVRHYICRYIYVLIVFKRKKK